MADRNQLIASLLEGRKRIAWSPQRVARIDNELRKLGYEKPSEKAERQTERAEATESKAVRPKRTYNKRK